MYDSSYVSKYAAARGMQMKMEILNTGDNFVHEKNTSDN
jgi:hypothetical protein